MATQITKSKFLQLYENDELKNVFTVQVGTEQRVYAFYVETSIEKVVYAVV